MFRWTFRFKFLMVKKFINITDTLKKSLPLPASALVGDTLPSLSTNELNKSRLQKANKRRPTFPKSWKPGHKHVWRQNTLTDDKKRIDKPGNYSSRSFRLPTSIFTYEYNVTFCCFDWSMGRLLEITIHARYIIYILLNLAICYARVWDTFIRSTISLDSCDGKHWLDCHGRYSTAFLPNDNRQPEV